MQKININRMLVAGVVMGVFAGAQAQSVYQATTNLDKTGINGLSTNGVEAGKPNNDLAVEGLGGATGNGTIAGGHGRVFTPEPVSMTLMAGCSFASYLRMRRRKQK